MPTQCALKLRIQLRPRHSPCFCGSCIRMNVLVHRQVSDQGVIGVMEEIKQGKGWLVDDWGVI